MWIIFGSDALRKPTYGFAKEGQKSNVYRKPSPATWRCQCPRATPDLRSWVRGADYLPLAVCQESSGHWADGRARSVLALLGCAQALGGLSAAQVWQSFAPLAGAGAAGLQEGHSHPTHVSLVGVCAMLALQTGDQSLLGQVAHGPHRVQAPLDLCSPGGHGTNRKQHKNQKLFPWPQQKVFPLCHTSPWVADFSNSPAYKKCSCSAEVPDSKNAWGEIEIGFFSSVAQKFSQSSWHWKRKNIALLGISAKGSQGDTCHLRWVAHAGI